MFARFLCPDMTGVYPITMFRTRAVARNTESVAISAGIALRFFIPSPFSVDWCRLPVDGNDRHAVGRSVEPAHRGTGEATVLRAEPCHSQAHSSLGRYKTGRHDKPRPRFRRSCAAHRSSESA
jgi:hypothetical protein